MSAILVPDLILTWEMQDIREAFRQVSTDGGPAGFSIAALPSEPAGWQMGSQCLLVDGSAAPPGAGDLLLQANANARAGGFAWRPDQDVTVGPMLIAGVHDHLAGSQGFSFARDTSQHIRLMDAAGLNTWATSALTYGTGSDWYWLAFQYDQDGAGTGSIRIAIYDSSRVLKEMMGLSGLQNVLPTGGADALQVGHKGGNTTGKHYISNIYIAQGAGYWAPIAPNITFAFPNAVSTDNANWVQGDGGGAGKETYVNEAPPVDTAASYLKRTAGAGTATIYFSHASLSAELSGQNILAVAAWARFLSTFTSTTNAFRTALRYSATNKLGVTRNMRNIANVITANAWGYEAYLCDRNDPLGTAWTPTSADGAEMGAGSSGIAAFTEERISQVVKYIAYGADGPALNDQTRRRFAMAA